MSFWKRIIISLSILIAVLVGQGWSAAPTTHFDLPHDPHDPALQTPGYIGFIFVPSNKSYRLQLYDLIKFPLTTLTEHSQSLIMIRVLQTVDSIGQVLNDPVYLGDIYFPTDGHQPTSENAVIWSCANIDNREDSPITEWYMQMFGVIPVTPGGVFLKAGWVNQYNNSQASRIIIFPISIEGHSRDYHQINDSIIEDPDRPGNRISRMDLFKKQFRKIASTSVGRVLLYRLLIEIRRQTSNTNSAGCLEKQNPALDSSFDGINIRNNNRSVEIYSGETSLYIASSNLIRIREIKDIMKQPTTINQFVRLTDNGYTLIEQSESSLDISLFHEMIHWYYYLRHPKRSNEEKGSDDRTEPYRIYEHYLGRYYWGDLDHHSSCLLENCLRYNDKGKQYVSFDYWTHFNEMRTILGSARDIENNNYKEGDDLSENLYRMCIGVPLRFGHSIYKFYEDSRVTEKVIDTTLKNSTYYEKACSPPENTPHSEEIQALPRKGLGNCRKQKHGSL